MEAVRVSLRAQGLSPDVASLAAGARRPSTYRSYDSRLSRFRKWCSERSVCPTNASLEQVSSFFKCLFDEGKQVNTIKNFRSAIGAIHFGFPDGSTLGSNVVLAQLVKGMGNVRPVVRSLAPSWSIEPMHLSSLPDLTHKTLFLVAAASARRRSCLQALSMKPGFIRFEAHGVRLIPDPEFLPKNQTLDFVPGDIFIPEIKTMSSISEDRFWCPV